MISKLWKYVKRGVLIVLFVPVALAVWDWLRGFRKGGAIRPAAGTNHRSLPSFHELEERNSQEQTRIATEAESDRLKIRAETQADRDYFKDKFGGNQ